MTTGRISFSASSPNLDFIGTRSYKPGFSWNGPWDDESRLNLSGLWMHHVLIPRLKHLWPATDDSNVDHAKQILQKVIDGDLPVTVGGIAASLLSEGDCRGLSQLLGSLSPGDNWRLMQSLMKIQRRDLAESKDPTLQEMTQKDGPDQMWALRRLIAKDRPQALKEIAARARDDPDEKRGQGFTQWYEFLKKQR
jgi:hypothetical protein